MTPPLTARRLVLVRDAPGATAVAAFWGGLLEVEPERTPTGALLPGDGTRPGLRFDEAAPEDGGRPLHLHVTTEGAPGLDGTVALARRLGATALDVGQRPEEGHVVLADPGGEPLCVIPPDSSFLAGCGRLGEVACDGLRAVGVFWSAVLGWPLVWDEDGETAVQSPAGGTKVAWGGPPVTRKHGRNRVRFEVVLDRSAGAAALAEEVERILALGATRSARPGELLDPEGNELTVVPAG